MTGPVCTAPCVSDADCANAKFGDAGAPGDILCKTGFICMVPMTVGPFACKKLCACTDSLNVPPGGRQTPAVCLDAGSP